MNEAMKGAWEQTLGSKMASQRLEGHMIVDIEWDSWYWLLHLDDDTVLTCWDRGSDLSQGTEALVQVEFED